jgi:hypothetical protein
MKIIPEFSIWNCPFNNKSCNTKTACKKCCDHVQIDYETKLCEHCGKDLTEYLSEKDEDYQYEMEK